jgi:NADPH2:quinone reductase
MPLLGNVTIVVGAKVCRSRRARRPGKRDGGTVKGAVVDVIAIEISRPGDPDVLVPVERPDPTAGADEVLIKVAAAGVNRPDVMQRLGKYPPPPGASDIPGLEVSGTVVALGEGVRGIGIGDAVCALVSGGGYAEYCAAPAPQCLPVPSGMDVADAAAIPETFFTVWTNVFERGRLKAGETILIHGGSSGIGTTAIQLARARGSKVFATAGSDEKCRACERLGAERCINYKDENFLEAIRALTANRGVDVVLDMIGGEYFARNVEALAVEGRLVQIATQQGARVEVNLLAMMQRRLTITGSTLRARSVAEKGAIAAGVREAVWPLLESGAVRPVIARRFSLREAAAAHRLMESSTHVGKIILVA